MANQVNHVTVSAEVKVDTGKLHYIKWVKVIVHGSGSFTEEVFGGQETIVLTLEHGHVSQGKGAHALKVGDPVQITAQQDHHDISWPVSFVVTSAQHPWVFTGKSK